MDAVPKDCWYFLVLVISLPFLKVSEQVRASGSSVWLQDGMVLDCLCPWTGKLSMVSWIKQPDKELLAIYHPEYGAHFAKMYDGRVEFLKASPMDGSISIRNVTDKDVGLYSCSLQAFPEGSWTKDTLVEKQVISATTSIHPDSELTVSENDNLTLRCLHVRNDPVNGVTMERLKVREGGDVRGQVLAVCSVHQGSVELREFVSRGSVTCSDTANVSLHLHPVSQEDGGMYRCHISTNNDSYASTILLTVFPSRGWRLFSVGLNLFVLIRCCVVLNLTKVKRRREAYRIQLDPAKRRVRA
uniref:Ig-like domain-containing protein n=1 Tax=Electrophorus electricus TaxID=8005 RepID=A0A4W4F6G7_ELEEL